jgi:hypothetical protein
VGGQRRTRAGSCEGYEDVKDAGSGPLVPTSTTRWLAGSPSIRAHRELNTGQWCLFAPVQPGNEIKSAMFRKKARSKSATASAEPCGTGLLSAVGNRMPPRQFIERQMRLRIIERETDNDILTAHLPPQPIR